MSVLRYNGNKWLKKRFGLLRTGKNDIFSSKQRSFGFIFNSSFFNWDFFCHADFDQSIQLTQKIGFDVASAENLVRVRNETKWCRTHFFQDVAGKFFFFCEKSFLELNVEINASNMSARVVKDLTSDRRNLGSDPAGDGLLSFYFSLFVKNSYNFGFWSDIWASGSALVWIDSKRLGIQNLIGIWFLIKDESGHKNYLFFKKNLDSTWPAKW